MSGKDFTATHHCSTPIRRLMTPPASGHWTPRSWRRFKPACHPCEQPAGRREGCRKTAYRIELLRDVFIWSYERSAGRCAAVRQSLGEPDSFRLRHRDALPAVVAEVVQGRMTERRLLSTSHHDANYQPDGYNVGRNGGAAAGQEIRHAHLHVIPRFKDEPYAAALRFLPDVEEVGSWTRDAIQRGRYDRIG